jgi:hypothetical protein
MRHYAIHYPKKIEVAKLVAPELIQGPGVLPNRGYKSIYKRELVGTRKTKTQKTSKLSEL